MRNEEIAKIFFEVADILEMQNVQWKPKAYRAAAFAIESLGEPVADIYKRGGLKALEEIPGVGEAIAKKIEELIKTEKLGYLDELRKSMPLDVEALNAVPGLGPKKLMALYKKLKVRNIGDLRKAAEQHKIMKLPGFGEKSEAEILKSIAAGGKEKERVPYEKALAAANGIVRLMRGLPEAQKAEAAGSIRRKLQTIGDIDILVASEQPAAITKAFVSMPGARKVLASGETKSSVVLRSGMQADLRVVLPEQWGSALQYFTGSKAHSIELRKIAIKKGLKLSEYGVFRGSEAVASETEEDVYGALGLDYIPPEERENEGEIGKAVKRFNAKKEKP